MIELFSCRNCVQNAGQGLSIGAGRGFCLQFNTPIENPERTTCKYLHRKDLPRFLVDEGLREHASEFASSYGMVDLHTKRDIPKHSYNERRDWERGRFDPLLNSLSQYHRRKSQEEDTEEDSGWKWRFIQTYAGGLDTQRALVHVSLIRRYMHHCGTWVSSWRLMLAAINDVDTAPVLEPRELRLSKERPESVVKEDALWEIIFSRLSAIQEFGFHAAIEEFRWVTDSMNGTLSSLDWSKLRPELTKKKKAWTSMIMTLAKKENVFFAPTQD